MRSLSFVVQPVCRDYLAVNTTLGKKTKPPLRHPETKVTDHEPLSQHVVNTVIWHLIPEAPRKLLRWRSSRGPMFDDKVYQP
jgi:hypothetical protein